MADSDDGDTLNITPGDRDAIVRTVLGEDGNQGGLGQAAVTHVIMNRAIGGGASPTSIVMAPNQFEANANGLKSYEPNSAAYQNAAKVVDGVLSGDIPDPTNGATNFLNPQTVMARSGRLPKWEQGDGVRIGQHVFLGGRGPAMAADAPDAPAAITAAVQPAQQQPAQAGQGSVPPGLLAFVPDGLSHAVDQDPATAPIITSAAPPTPRGEPAPSGSPPAMSDADLEAMLTGKPAQPTAAASGPQAPGVSFAPPTTTPPAAAASDPTHMSDDALEAMLTGKGGKTLDTHGIAALVTSEVTGKPIAGATPPALTPEQLASGIDPQTGERVGGGKPFTSDAGHWNGLVNFANGALQGAGTDIMAAAAAAKAKLYDNDPKSLSDLYDQAKSTYQGGRQAYASSNPLLSALTETGGSLATAVPAMAAGGAGLAATAMRSWTACEPRRSSRAPHRQWRPRATSSRVPLARVVQHRAHQLPRAQRTRCSGAPRSPLVALQRVRRVRPSRPGCRISRSPIRSGRERSSELPPESVHRRCSAR